MKKLLIFVAAVALTGGSYFLLTQVNKTQESAATPSNKLDVEEFDSQVGDETAGAEYYENDYDRYDDPASGMLEGQDEEQLRKQMQQVNAADLEPIDDADAPSQVTPKDQASAQDKTPQTEPLTTARAR